MNAPDDDLAKSPQQLITEMQELIRGSSGNPAFNTITAMSALRKFACVLVVVGREADAQSRRVIALTRALLWLTITLLVIAAAQTALMFVEHSSSAWGVAGRYYFSARDDGWFRGDTRTGEAVVVGTSQGQVHTVKIPFDK
jgi:hypothetical protein